MSTSNEVTQEDLQDLLASFEKKAFEAGSCEEGTLDTDVTNKCEFLFKKDYTLTELDNTNGLLCPRYPARIFIPEHEHGHMASTLTPNTTVYFPSTSNTTPQNALLYNTACSNDPSSATGTPNKGLHTNVTFASSAMQQQTSPSNTTNNTIYEDQYDAGKIRELITMAKYARCRQRFVVPVMMYRGKCICRSATISVNAETIARKVVDCAYDYIAGTTYGERSNTATVDDENNDNSEDSLFNQALSEQSPFSYEEVIKSDIQLLKALNVTTIVDLMVEKRKIKYFMAVSSSEKADPENHYENFNILSLPYPGCEFFKKFRDNNYMAKNLYYTWDLPLNDAPISVPKLRSTVDLNINWDEYKSWDLVLITQNYIKVCLKHIQEENKGLLIHCISGWDRTPLFISLVRLSLWADGLIHQSLNALQITYFTLAYDWYLFGHQLPDRLHRGEDIMFFCFHVLKHIADEEFSIVEYRKRTKTPSSSGSSASVIILKSDSCDDDSKEDINLSCDQDSNDSFSNSSNCDMSIMDNYYANTSPPAQGSGNNPLTHRSPNAKRSKTSPISVPGANARRQRHESSSSGDWNFVTDTGSLDSTINSSLSSHSSHQQDINGGSTSNSNTPRNTSNNALNNILNNVAATTKDGTPSTTAKPPPTFRQQRLNAVRAIFIRNYGKAIGLKFKEGSRMNIQSLIGSALEQLF